MKNIHLILLAGLLTGLTLAAPAAPGAFGFREIRYDGRLTDDDARFVLEVDAEITGTGEVVAPFLQGNVAVLPGKLPDALTLVRQGDQYQLKATRAGQFKFKVEVVAKIQRAEPWNQILFTGPTATIASVTAQAAGTGMEIQLLNGTLLESTHTNGLSRVKGFLGADQTISFRWQGKVTEVARKALLTTESALTAQLTPGVVKYTSQFQYDIVQGSVPRLTLALPVSQALTRLVGEQIRDWHTAVEGDRQILTVEFIKPVEKSYHLALYSEQAVEGAETSLRPPQPLEVERESGALTVLAEDTVVDIQSLAGLRQVNAPDKALAAYRFNARPFTVALRLRHIEPVLSAADRITARLEETRLVISHAVTLNVEKAGIYAVELVPQPGFAVAEVRGEGVEDWKVADGKVRVSFAARVLGSRRLEVQLEQPLKTFPEQISVAALKTVGATRETAQLGAASGAGIRLRTSTLAGLREIPVNALPGHTDELLAYTTEQSDWKLTLGSERLAARIVADVFNLVTIGDGIVGGSATIRYGLVNQGVQEFRVKLPAHCRNVEFTGPNIRRKEFAGGSWTIGLQDKAWGGYTLVVTYDFDFNPQGDSLTMAGIHAVDAERETGSIAITTAASLQLSAKSASETLHRVDEQELPVADRSFITRAVVLAYQYTGDQYALAVDVKRYAQEPVLEAVADRTQITSVLTEAGEMLTQASFMVKNNQKQFQGFQLPKDGKLWGCYVNGQPAKPERDGDWVLVSLPREVNRDRAFAVDIMYAQTNGALGSAWSKKLNLTAPRTDVPNTYAEWQIFVPATFRASHFGGSMNIAQGTTYELLDAWEKFIAFYIQVLREMGGAILFFGLLAALVIAFVIAAVRRGWSGLLNLVVVVAILAVLAAMLLPALSKAKSRAQHISSLNSLKQIGLAARIWSGDNGDRLPMSFEEMKNELGTDRVTYDTATGQRFTYIGGGLSLNEITPDSVIAYGPLVDGRCPVLMADGSVQQLNAQSFSQLNERGLIRRAGSQQLAAQQQAAVNRGQLAFASAAPASVATVNGSVDGFGTSGFGGAPASGLPPVNAPQPTAAGIRSLRIELPQTGQPFLFTKVLNVRDEPLSISARLMPVRTFQNLQMAWQSAAFVLGLACWWWQWRGPRHSFLLTLALALMLGSVCSLLVQWRALHDALIIGFPLVTIAVLALLVWKYWPRHRAAPPVRPSVPPMMDAGTTSATVALALFLGLSQLNAAPKSIVLSDSEGFIRTADYAGTVNDRVALIEATMRFSAAAAGQSFPVLNNDVVVQQFTVKEGRAQLVRDARGLAVRLDKKGDAVVQLKLLVKVAGDVTKRRLDFEIPPALTSQVTLTLDQAEADVDFPAAVSFRRVLEKDKTRVEAVMGSGSRVELLWTPRVKRAAEVAATVFSQNASIVTLGGGVMNVRSVLDYQVTQGELRQARVKIPAGQRLLRVEAPNLRTWEIRERTAEGDILLVDLLKGVSPAWRLTVETERALEPLPASVDVAIPHALDVKRETGLVGLKGAEELGLSVEAMAELQRVDGEEFARAGVDQAGNLVSGFRFTKPEFSLRARVEAVQPQIEALAKNYFRIGNEQTSLSAMLDFTIKRAGVFALKVSLPEGYRLDQVNGANILQHAERMENGGRVLEITLKDRTTGTYRLGLELSRTFKTLPKSLAVAGVQPLGASKLTGFVAVTSEAGVAVKTESFDGLTEIPAVALPDYMTSAGGNVLAYKFIAAAPGSAPDWKLSVAPEPMASWVRAEIVNTLTLADTLITGHALVRYDIANAPVKELRVKVPEQYRNVEITGPNIRSRSRDGSLWRIELQSATRGFYTLNVSWEQFRDAKTNVVELTGVTAEGVERESGVLSIAAKAPLQVTELRATELQRVDLGDVPDWAGRDATATLIYHYARPGYSLTLAARRFGEMDVLQVLVDNAHLTTVVADDGQVMTEMALSVRNNGRQFLEVELPAGARIWSAFVAGEAVRPSLREGRLLLPIQPSSADDRALSVELTYVGVNPFPKGRGTFGLESPKLDVPLKNARWEVYLPPDFDYGNFAGTMSRETAAAATSSASFSILDYSRMETATKQTAKAEARKDVVEAQRKLAGGNMREANASFYRAKGKFQAAPADELEVKKLENDLKTAAVSNLINAQNDFAIRNSSAFSADRSPAGAKEMPLYDNAAAAQQWDKLQQAQEIVAAKVQPLRVNLPVRGTLLSFSQVLQTETARPMTIELFAASTKPVNWPQRIGMGLGTFAGLWAMVAGFCRMTRPAAAG
ncbi:MAG: hypothetical protein U1F65_02530 [Verrucomicrobiota bacterium]